MNICYLIDVMPEKFTGGGQAHLVALECEILIQNSEFRIQNFAGLSPHIFLRLAWMLYVIPQVIFHHFFKQQFSLIHAHSIPAMVSGKVLSMILGIPIVVTVHGYNESRWVEKFILTKIKYDSQITVSRNFLQLPNINKNVIYIPNGIDIVKFTKLHHRARRFINFPATRILFVGRRSDPVKGFSILLRAFELVKKEIPEVKLLIAGGDLPQGEVPRLYQQADLFVLPSLSEGFPLTLLEAWAAKLPVVATGVGELPYLIKDGVNGYLVDPGSAGQLALTVIKALKNKNLAKLGENGYNLAKEYTWERAVSETLRVYQKIC